MKILLVSGIYPPDVGGPATFVPQLASACIERGYKVKVLTLSDAGFKRKDSTVVELIRLPRNLPLPIRFAVTVAIIGLHSIRGYRIFANGLHEESGIALFLTKGLGVAKIVGDPVWERAVNSARTNLGILDFNESRLSWINQQQRNLLVYALNKFKSVITPSEELQSLARSWNIKRSVNWVPNGVSIKPHTNIEKSIDVITVSRLVPWKNVDILVRAANDCGFSLCIVGDGPELENLVALSDGNKNVMLKGRLSQVEVDELLMRSRIFALISDYEGLSFSLLQAMSFGLPVVVSNTSGNASVVSKSSNGITIDPKLNNEVGISILKLLRDTEKLKSYSEKSRESSENSYSIEVCLERTIREVVC